MRHQLQTLLHKMDRTHVSSREVIKLLNPTQFVSMQYGLWFCDGKILWIQHQWWFMDFDEDTCSFSLSSRADVHKKFLPFEEFSLLKFSIPSLSSAAFWFPAWAISVSIVPQTQYHIPIHGLETRKKERWKQDTENSVNWSWSQTERWPPALCLNLWVCVAGRVLISAFAS